MNYGAYMRKVKNTRTQTIGFQNGQDSSLQTMKVQARANTVTHLSNLEPVPTNFSKIGGSVANILETSQQTNTPNDQKTAIFVAPSKTTSQVVTLAGYNGFASGLRTADMTANLIGAKQNAAVCSDAPSSKPYNIIVPPGIFIDPISYNPNPNTRQPQVSISNVTLYPGNSTVIPGIVAGQNAPAWNDPPIWPVGGSAINVQITRPVATPTWNNPPTWATPGSAPSTRDQLYGGGTVAGQTMNYNSANTTSNSGRDAVNLAILDAERVRVQGQQAALRTKFNLPPKLDSLRGPVYNASRN
jgi:hypothetical protein